VIEWLITTSLDVEFVVKRTEKILEPSNPELCSYGSSDRRIIFVDSNVFCNFGKKIISYFKKNKIKAKIISIDISEEKKDLDTLMYILKCLEDFGLLRRSEPIISIGGGVLLDVVGLAASIYRRGVPYIKVPTTLLAVVDASVGVKTSINHFNRRNRLGTYYAPCVSLLDTQFFVTLPCREIYSAMGEIIKIAVIKNLSLFKVLEINAKDLISSKFGHKSSSEVIETSIHDMILELESNLWEKNLKRCVDFGHSFSPLLEMRSLKNKNVNDLTHGEAVSLDVIFSCCLSVYKNLMDYSELLRVVKVCKDSKLPIFHEFYEDKIMLWEALLDTTKHRNGNQNLPIPISIGSYVFIQDITLEDIEKSILIYRKVLNEIK
jgi:2-epi-5-epi-valiolone synthase